MEERYMFQAMINGAQGIMAIVANVRDQLELMESLEWIDAHKQALAIVKKNILRDSFKI